MLTLYLRTPINGIRREGHLRKSWTIDKIECPPLPTNAPAPEPELVRSCHGGMRDGQGKQVRVEELQRYDLREGLAAAFRAVQFMPGSEEVVA